MLTYKDSGVDIDKGNNFVSFIKQNQMKDYSVVSNIGGYNALVDITHYNIKDPILLFSTDGVGTKLKLAKELKDYENIGIDLVAMVANDIICSGGIPKIFLDYIAYSNLSDAVLKSLYIGIVKGCQLAEMTLIGGETAQLPEVYNKKNFDLAGFGMGIVERDKIISQNKVKEGDIILGIESSGLHSNGFALINQILFNDGIDIHHEKNIALKKVLLTPTYIYTSQLSYYLKYDIDTIHGLAHITGGGFIDNIPRILPENLYAEINYDIPKYYTDEFCWTDVIKDPKNIFYFLHKRFEITKEEMFKTFNCGIGMIVIIKPEAVDKFKYYWNSNDKVKCFNIGVIKKFPNTQVYFKE